MSSRIAVLASGGGSNLQAILDYFDALGAAQRSRVVVVASNRSQAGALTRASARDIPTAVLVGPKQPDGASLGDVLDEQEVDLVVLAGYLKLLPSDVVKRYDGRIINVHPALLPAFGGHGMYGNNVHRAVLESGAKVTGVTVHFVNDVYDSGRIIAQWPVPVFGSDDVASLAARVLRVEHIVYPRVVDAVAAGRTALATVAAASEVGAIDSRPSFTLLSHEESRLAENIELALGC
ncbi:MAG TPA: phosphoribosylglycinamide formyltransferase [Gemmatimonadaceae bacterium]|jgi:formyltetrahydrofolate-dependent phosphoribosylglycinamide formyltransferase